MHRPTRSILITLIAVLAVAAPAAQARPAVDTGYPAADTELTIGQMHRTDGAQPIATPDPVSDVAPLNDSPAPGTDYTPWLFVVVPLALMLGAGGVRKATHRTLFPHRASHAKA